MNAGASKLTNFYQTTNAIYLYPGVRRCEISLIVKRERAQIYS